MSYDKCKNKVKIAKIKNENYDILNFLLHKVLAIDVTL